MILIYMVLSIPGLIEVGNDLIQVRLDRALISNDWLLKYKCNLSAQVRVGSDHYPIFLVANKINYHKNFPFNFEKMWSLETLIKEWWDIQVDGTAMFKVVAKLKNVKKKIKIWNKNTFGNIFDNKNKIMEELKEIQDKIQLEGYETFSRDEKSRKLVELHDIISKEETFWMRCSRKVFLKERDRNTKFFHITTLKHRMANRICRLTMDEGSTDNEEIIKREVVDFFKSLLQESNLDLVKQDSFLQCIPSCVSED